MNEDTMYHNIVIPEFARLLDEESNWCIFSLSIKTSNRIWEWKMVGKKVTEMSKIKIKKCLYN